MMHVSNSSPYRSVHVARSQRWSWDRQYPTNSTLYFCDASPNVSPSSVCLSFTGAKMKGGVYRRRHSGLCRTGGEIVRILWKKGQHLVTHSALSFDPCLHLSRRNSQQTFQKHFLSFVLSSHSFDQYSEIPCPSPHNYSLSRMDFISVSHKKVAPAA